jgi:hypothetical protein
MDSIEVKFLALVEPMDILKTAAKIYRDISERNLFENPLSLRENMFYNGRMFERVTLALIELGEDVAQFEKMSKDYTTMVSTASEGAQEYFSTLMMGELWKDCADYLCAILAKLKREKDTQSQFDDIQENTRIAAARTRKELDAKSKGGKKGARIQKEEKSEDEKKTRKAILDNVKNLIRERDKRYPNGNFPDSQTNNAIFRSVSKSKKYLKADGTPIMSVDAIKKAYQRAKKQV